MVKRARPALSSHRALACIARSGYFSCTWREQPRCTQCANEVLHLSKRYNLFRIVVGRIRVRACWDLVGCGVWRLRNSPRAKTSNRHAWPAKYARSDGLGDWGRDPGEIPVLTFGSRVEWTVVDADAQAGAWHQERRAGKLRRLQSLTTDFSRSTLSAPNSR